MQQQIDSTTAATSRRTAPRRRARAACRLLVVDADATAATTVARACAGKALRIERVSTAADARALAAARPVDAAVIATALPDADPLELARQLRQSRDRTQVILTGPPPRSETLLAAMNQGVLDYLVTPLDPARLRQRVDEMLARRRRRHRQAWRVRELRRACRKLDDARRDVGHRVDQLAGDLVSAYQELAREMEQNVHVSQYQALVRQELDLAPLLQKTLEYLIEHVGPCNAAVFLPATTDEYAVGAYVNYDCAGDAVEMLLEHVADTAVADLAESPTPVHVRDEAAMQKLLGDAGGVLLKCEMLALGCHHDDEPLAAILLFRDRDEPFDAAALPVCEAVSHALADGLARLIRVHHRTSMWEE